MEKYSTPPIHGDNMWNMAETLFPIHRTIVNKGFRDSLEIIKEHLDITILEYESGKEVWDWIIPDAWDVKDAYIKNESGDIIVDFRNNNLHLAAYSMPFRDRISKEELLEHIWTLPEQPDAIPYRTLYYTANDWKFCLAHKDLCKFEDGEFYEVCIDVDMKPGKLCIGEYYLPGESEKEIILTSYLCHPSLANDNLSGVVLAVETMNILKTLKNRRYSYSLLIVPEAIGTTTYLATHEEQIEDIAGGYVFTCCGDSGKITYKKSYKGDTFVDDAAAFVITQKYGGDDSSVRDFWPNGSDEQKYNAPGVRLPVGSIMRTPYSEFPEYHTSRDNLEYISKEYLLDTLDTAIKTINILDNNEMLRNTFRGEPFLTKHGIYKSTDLKKPDKKSDAYIQRVLMMEIDGTNSLLNISQKWGYEFDDVYEVSRSFLKAGLVKPV